MSRLARLAMAAVLVLVGAACTDSNDGADLTIAEIAARDSRFTALADALDATGLDEALSGEGPFTVFAPTDAAFGLLPDGLVLDIPTLTAVLEYHVVAGELTAMEIIAAATQDGQVFAATAAMEEDAEPAFSVQVFGGTVVLDGRVQVTSTDVMASNGIIHVIDAVLIPGAFPGTVVDALVASPRFSTLVGAVVGEGLAGPLATDNGGDGFTVFAPTDNAFDRLPAGLVATLAAGGALDDVLSYHVLPQTVDAMGAVAADGASVDTLALDAEDGDEPFEVSIDLDGDGDLYLDGRTQVTFTDIEASNGVIHVLDSVLVPGVDFPGSTVEMLVAYPRFDTLVGAVVDEMLASAVADVTVFAPTNDAFASLPMGTLDALMQGDLLAGVLAYHLLDGAVASDELMETEATLQGESITIDTSSGVLLNGSSNVIFADLFTTDGVVHVIDGVLVPPSLTN